MAEAALIGAAAEKVDVKEITEAIKTGVEVGVKIEREAERVEKKLYDILQRENRGYDYEKVAVRSLYGTGIFAVGWLGLKLGLFMVGLTNALNNIPILGWTIPDDAIDQMLQVGNVLNEIDARFMTPYGPAVPVAITGASAFIEYLRVREDMPPKQRKMADAACGLTALGILYAVNEGINMPRTVFNCRVCTASFASEAELEAHMESEHQLSFCCSICVGVCFATAEELTQHVLDAHRRGPQ